MIAILAAIAFLSATYGAQVTLNIESALLIGATLGLRDLVHARYGPQVAVVLVFLGAIVTALWAPLAIIGAATGAYVMAQMADALAFAAVRFRGMAVAVLISGGIGALVDTLAFALLREAPMVALHEQVAGKMLGSVVLAMAVWMWMGDDVMEHEIE